MSEQKSKASVRWTPDQERVISTRGGNLLVSASAGSGKTAVLVERILSFLLDKEDPADIDQLLIVTFTRAAAAEMKERIGNRISELLMKDPGNKNLARQSTLIHNAQITTIDGFCSYVVRSYGHLTDLEPGWRIADEGESRLLKADVLAEILEETFKSEDETMKAQFPVFVESLATGKSEKPMEETILRVFEAAESQPWPREWLERSRMDVFAETEEELMALPWMQSLMADADSIIGDGLVLARQNLALTRSATGPSAYMPCAEADVTLFERLLETRDYGRRVRLLWDFEPPRLSTKKPLVTEDPALREVFKTTRGKVKDIREMLAKEIFFCMPEEALETLKGTAVPMNVLISVVEAFMDRFAARKREKKLIDFADLEHYALKILRGEDGRTPAAKELSRRFREVMVDEYQDSNYLQEEILTAVSRIEDGTDNYFCVGDVKQSIYGFRHARPDLFMEKFRLYGGAGEGAESAHSVAVRGTRIDLRTNFRSGAEVLDSANGLFEMMMRREVGGVDYDEDAKLICGLSALGKLKEELARKMSAREKVDDQESGLRLDADINKIQAEIEREERLGGMAGTEIMVAVADEEDSEGETVLSDTGSQARRELEARMIGERIRKMVREDKIYDRKTGEFRPVAYRDIVILLRTMSGWAEVFSQVLEGMGIPAYSTAKTGYFSAPEVRTILDYLAILDNPEQDIPFASVLKSAIGGLGAEDLARIRVISGRPDLGEGRFLSMAECARRYLALGEDEAIRAKLRRFFDFYNETREMTASIPIHELIWHILTGTGFFDYATALPGGTQRAANLRMLVEKAIAYEETSYVGLFNFIRYIEKLQSYDVDFGEVSVIGENEDTVRIISIHKSKGLEYPVVFVAGMGKAFNKRDLSSRVLIDPDRGVAMDYVDLDRRTVSPTLKKQAVRRKLLRENVGEEIRVLYVAMTRARQKMILTGSIKQKELDNLSKIEPADGQRFSSNYLLNATCPWSIILPAVLKLAKNRGEERYPREITRICPTELAAADVREGVSRQMVVAGLKGLDPTALWDEEMKAVLDSRFSFSYPYAGREKVPVKVSVTELKKAHMHDEEAVDLAAIHKDDEFEARRTEEGGFERLQAGGEYTEKARTGEESAKEIMSGEESAKEIPPGEESAKEIPPGEESKEKIRVREEELEDYISWEEIPEELEDYIPWDEIPEESTAVPEELPEPMYVPVFARTGDDTRAYEADDTPATVRGSACHKVMELLDFDRFDSGADEDAAASEIARMLHENRMTAEDAALVRPGEIAAMAASPLGRRMAAAAARGDLFREQPFVLGVSASDLRSEWPEDEQVIVQGIVDAFFFEGDHIVLIDYKTDRVPFGREGEERLAGRYRVQLDAYQEALERVSGRKVTEKYLWSFHLGRAVPV